VDTFVAPAWPKLKEALDGLGNAPVKYVIDTHWRRAANVELQRTRLPPKKPSCIAAFPVASIGARADQQSQP